MPNVGEFIHNELKNFPPEGLWAHDPEAVIDFLEHHGVKGMKWGVRRAGNNVTPGHGDGGSKVASDRGPHEDFSAARILKSKGPANLSTKELKDVNDRLSAEQRFAQLNPTKLQRTHNKAKAILAVAGTAAAFYKAYHSPAGQAAIKKARSFAMKKLADPKEAAKFANFGEKAAVSIVRTV